MLTEGPLKAELLLVHKISDVSSIKQVISLTCIGERLEFDNVVDWHESHQFLVTLLFKKNRLLQSLNII